MEDKFEKKLKAYLPFIIIIGVVYLFLPILLVVKKDTSLVLNNLVYIGVFPLTALICCGIYSYRKNIDILVALIAPLFYIPSMFLYGNFKYNAFTSIIYLIAYFLCGFLGLLIGDILSPKKKKKRQAARAERERPMSNDIDIDEEPSVMTEHREVRIPRKVNTHAARRSRPSHMEEPRHIKTEDPFEDHSLDTSTTSDDINAILAEIHSRRNNQ